MENEESLQKKSILIYLILKHLLSQAHFNSLFFDDEGKCCMMLQCLPCLLLLTLTPLPCPLHPSNYIPSPSHGGICSNRSSLPNNLATLKSLQTHEHKQEATLYVTTWLFDIQCLYSEKAELHPFLWQSIPLSL